MSTKTIKQRIALVAVSALTAGMFTVVSAPVANAAQVGLGTTQTAGTLIIDIDAPIGSAAAVTSTALGTGTSRGWVADTSASVASTAASGNAVSVSVGQAKTGNIIAGAVLSVQANTIAATSEGISIVVTNATLGSLTATSTNASVATVGEAILLSSNSRQATILGTGTTTGQTNAITMAALVTATS